MSRRRDEWAVSVGASPAAPVGASPAHDPKLELDDLIDQMMEHAQGVKRSRGRLRSLLRAIDVVSSELGLEPLLRQVTKAACELVNARYGALGVLSAEGAVIDLIHVGVSDAVVDQIGHLPAGRGLIGAVIAEPRPVRLRDLAEDPRSVGFPPGHPPMRSFLGVPIRVRGAVFGNLYLTESTLGEFSAEDEELAGLLAVAAGTAISNARLYAESQLQQQWLAASVEVSASLLGGTSKATLDLIGQRVHEVARADLVVVALLKPDDQVAVEVAIGSGAERLRGLSYGASQTMTRRSLDRHEAVSMAADDDYRTNSPLGDLMEAGPVVSVPLIGNRTTFGSLTIVRLAGRAAFTPAEIEMATTFASQASVALELADGKPPVQ